MIHVLLSNQKFVIFLLFLSVVSAYQHDHEEYFDDDYDGGTEHDYYQRFRSEQKSVDDYAIYSLMDRMSGLTNYSTFYELLGVNTVADSNTISSAFRRISRNWHPDRSKDPMAHEKFSLLAGVAGILKNPEARRRYDWILNEAPIWHKSGYYVRRYMTAKLTIYQVIFVIALILTIVQILKQLVIWCFAKYRRWDARSRLGKMGKNEFKSLKRRMERLGNEVTDLQLLQSSEIEDWMLANGEIEPLCLSRHVLLFKAIVYIYQNTFTIFSRLFRYDANKRE